MVRVHAGGGHRKMKKNWRGASLQGMFEEKVVVVVVGGGAGAGAGAGVCYGGLLQK